MGNHKGTFKFANKVLSHWRQGVLDEHLKKLSVNDPNANDADILINEDGEEIINQAKLENYNWSDSEDDEEDEDAVNGGSSTAKKALKDVGKIADVGKPDKITLNCHQLLQFILLVTLQNLISDLPILMMHLGIQF